MVDRFLLCLPYTLVQEARPGTTPAEWVNSDGSINEACWNNPKNFSNDAHDPGGKTFCGIIQREYDLWRKGHSQPVQDVRKMTVAEGTAIYRIAYWMPHCPSLPPGLDMDFFDESVNSGTSEAIRILQVALGIADDGEWGVNTTAAVTLSASAPAKAVEAFTNRRALVYREMKGFPYFGTDWLRRTAEIGAEALKMAGGQS